jgi:hypothetical protein
MVPNSAGSIEGIAGGGRRRAIQDGGRNRLNSRANAKSRRAPGATVVTPFEVRRRGDYFIFAAGNAPCACGFNRLLIPLPLRISSQPFLDAARALLAAGLSPDSWLILKRDDVALRAKLSVAASLRTTDDRMGTPIFARHRANSQQRARPCVVGSAGVSDGRAENNERVGLLLHLPGKEAA